MPSSRAEAIGQLAKSSGRVQIFFVKSLSIGKKYVPYDDKIKTRDHAESNVCLNSFRDRRTAVASRKLSNAHESQTKKTLRRFG